MLEVQEELLKCETVKSLRDFRNWFQRCIIILEVFEEWE